MKRILVFAAALIALLALAGGPAVARDSDAPPGASPRWLPCEHWVMFHWLPYDETRLYSLLGVHRATVLRWARDDQHRTLGDLARRRGWKPDALASALVRPWRGRV
ncbi:MAG TPA: hypothetical protein VF752_04210, partial [Thermoleophilaceae bacterium]